VKLEPFVSTLGRRILVALALVLAITVLAGTWELYPLFSGQLPEPRIPEDLVWLEVGRWIAMMIASCLASTTAISLLGLTGGRSGALRTSTWIFVIFLIWSLPSYGAYWPEGFGDQWIELPPLYKYWPLISVIPIVLGIHFLGSRVKQHIR